MSASPGITEVDRLREAPPVAADTARLAAKLPVLFLLLTVVIEGSFGLGVACGEPAGVVERSFTRDERAFDFPTGALAFGFAGAFL